MFSEATSGTTSYQYHQWHVLLQTKLLLLLLTEVHKLFLDYFTSRKIHREINNFILTILNKIQSFSVSMSVIWKKLPSQLSNTLKLAWDRQKTRNKETKKKRQAAKYRQLNVCIYSYMHTLQQRPSCTHCSKDRHSHIGLRSHRQCCSTAHLSLWWGVTTCCWFYKNNVHVQLHLLSATTRDGGHLQEIPTIRLCLAKFWCFG